ncbi:threonine dehydratase [Saprospira grandis DSM 2844]|uniref:L-serine ammonia-lyase n=1 Tax=Saprospira grandis DSM 2844 TaxID=694433 RepID=J1I4V7_9BACT|nr:pyridoxal-phosphate dependent enzyme [Saprospira grandis]EJF53770.1 threonine dehydratase [Saprospira grandis DSM 2844]
MPLYQKTACRKQWGLSQRRRQNIYYKLDCQQPSGSFKIRGIGHYAEQLKAQGVLSLVIASGGNAGLAVAYAAQALQLKAEVVLPRSSSLFVEQLLLDLGAKVYRSGESWAEAQTLALELAQAPQAAYIPPFDHPMLWEGHSSLVKELAEQLPQPPDLILLSVGGGGLFKGVMQGLARQNWSTKVLCLETEGTASLHQSLAAGRQIELAKIEGIASSLGAKKVAQAAWEAAQSPQVYSRVLPDEQALEGVKQLLAETGHLTEPACGLVRAALVQDWPEIQAAKDIVAIICGGRTMPIEQLSL